ncbi:Peptidyl-prolyl cis-trans isomerase PpiD [uncultured Candidatus Thioglobus sp.]|nr:Peptidyl-prolyl cis-trans isomerase PpiD [uncultured Candidatus Thioglobus sp.]
MLSSIKSKIKGWVAYLVIGLITVPFALFGISEYFTGSENIIVADIDGDQISKQVFFQKFTPRKRQLQKELAENYTDESEISLKKSTISSIIDEHLLKRMAEQMGYVTTPLELQVFIKANDAFKVDEKFSLERYKQLLRLNGYTSAKYELEQVERLNQEQIKYNFSDSAFTTPSALKRMQALNDQQRKFSYIMLNAKDYLDETKVDPESIAAFFKENKQTFFDPQKIKVDFIELSSDNIAKNIKVDEEALLSLYEDEKGRFVEEEERQAQHILLESEELANTLVERLQKGEDFDKLAAEYSQDTTSKDKGGDLGFFGLGVMVPEFETKVFVMNEGDMSEPIKSEFGYHIIKLNKIKASTTKPFESVRDELSEIYIERATQKEIYNLTEQLANFAYETSLEDAAEQTGLKLETSEFFAQDTKKYDTKFIAAAYSDTVLNKAENSELIEVTKDKFMVLRVNDKQPQRQKTFDEVKTEINTHLADVLAESFVNNVARNITEALVKGDEDAANKMIKKSKLKWEDVDWIDRGSKETDTNIIGKVFSLPKPSDSPIYNAHNLSPQQVIIFKLLAVRAAPEPQQNSDLLAGVLLNFKSDEMFNSILQTLRKDAEIKIFANKL